MVFYVQNTYEAEMYRLLSFPPPPLVHFIFLVVTFLIARILSPTHVIDFFTIFVVIRTFGSSPLICRIQKINKIWQKNVFFSFFSHWTYHKHENKLNEYYGRMWRRMDAN